jgi:hypothetical protein
MPLLQAPVARYSEDGGEPTPPFFSRRDRTCPDVPAQNDSIPALRGRIPYEVSLFQLATRRRGRSRTSTLPIYFDLKKSM